jgi:FMN-dependent NADH-azoreductase
MSNILVLRSSVSGAGSVSNALIDEAPAALRAADPQAAVVNRDLAATPVPHLGADAFAGVRGAPVNDEQVARAVRNPDRRIAGREYSAHWRADV